MSKMTENDTNLTCGFYESDPNQIIGADRKYNALQLSQLTMGLATDGVLPLMGYHEYANKVVCVQYIDDWTDNNRISVKNAYAEKYPSCIGLYEDEYEYDDEKIVQLYYDHKLTNAITNCYLGYNGYVKYITASSPITTVGNTWVYNRFTISGEVGDIDVVGNNMLYYMQGLPINSETHYNPNGWHVCIINNVENDPTSNTYLLQTTEEGNFNFGQYSYYGLDNASDFTQYINNKIIVYDPKLCIIRKGSDSNDARNTIMNHCYKYVSTPFKVMPASDSMKIYVSAGRALFDDKWNYNSSNTYLTVEDNNDTTYGRIDAVVILTDASTRDNYLKIIKGDNFTSDYDAGCTWKDYIDEQTHIHLRIGTYHVLAYIYVPENSTIAGGSKISVHNIQSAIGLHLTGYDAPYATNIF